MTPQQLFDANRGLAYHISFRYKLPDDQDREDMEQEALIALWRACLSYDASHGARFTTYAGRAVENACAAFAIRAWNSSGLSAGTETIARARKADFAGDRLSPGYTRLTSTALSTDVRVYDEDDITLGDTIPTTDTYDLSDDEDTRRAILSVLDTLDRPTRAAIVARYGLDGREPMTCAEVGREMGVTREWARVLVSKGLARLRHPRNSNQLKDLR